MLCVSCTQSTDTDPCTHCGETATLMGRYQLQEALGAGSSGQTWRAIDPEGQAVAIKSIPITKVGGSKERTLVDREVRVLRELNHPGIPAYIEHMVLGDSPNIALWLVQELVPGQSLADELEEHRYTPREVLAIIAELAEILSYLHELAPPVIHRDIKPGNVMRRDDGRLMLIDFGSVRDVAKGSLGGSTVAGTFGFMAPEQFAGDAEPRSDLYGLGALAVALLTRKEPQSLSDHANRLCWAQHTSVPSGAHDLINRMVDPEIERRAPSADWVELRARTLLSADELQPGAAPPAAPVDVDRILERKPRGPGWWLMAGALLLTAGVVPVGLGIHGLNWLTHHQPADTIVRLPSPPDAEPRADRPLMKRTSADDEAEPRPLQRIVSTIGDDSGVQGCVAQHQDAFPGSTIQLEVQISPPNEVRNVSVGPSSLSKAAVTSCLERAVMRVAFHGVELERSGSVTLAFD